MTKRTTRSTARVGRHAPSEREAKASKNHVRRRHSPKDGQAVNPYLARVRAWQRHLDVGVLETIVLVHPAGAHLERIVQALDVVNAAQNYFRLRLQLDTHSQWLSVSSRSRRADSLRGRLQKAFPDKLVIAIIEQDLEGGLTIDEEPGCTIISCDDWPLSSDTPSMRSYFVYQITSALVTFAGCLTAEENFSLLHGAGDNDPDDGPRACLFDYWRTSDGFYMSMVGARLCTECRSALLAHGTPAEALLATEKLLVWIRSIVLGEERPLPRKVFIGHGHDRDWLQLKKMLEHWGLTVAEFNQVPVAGISVSQRLKAMLDESRFAFLVMTGEDEDNAGVLRARMNVIHEIGLFQGRLGTESAIVLRERSAETFSNIDGLNRIDYMAGKLNLLSGEIHRLLQVRGILAADVVL